MNTRRPYLTSVILVSAGLLLLVGYLALWMMADAPAGAGEAGNAVVRQLIERHNARQDRVVVVKLKGQCTWNLDMPGEPRAMAIVFDRATGKGSMVCGKDSCEIDGQNVKASAGSAMTVDALYLLMFRKFDPKAFTVGQGGESAKKTVVAKSEKETLEFEEQSGRLVGGTFQMKEGTVALTLGDYKELPGGAGEAVPTMITVVVPAEMFPFERTRGGSIVLKIDAAGSEIKRAP